MRRPALLALAAASTLVAAGTATASTDTAPVFSSERVYFHCTGPTKATNANLAAGSAIPTWDTSAPTGSVSGGAGCGTADPAFLVDGTAEKPTPTNLDGVWSGTFTGNLRSITVEAHAIYTGAARSGAFQFGVTPVVFVDGKRMVSDPATLRVTPVPSSTRASEKITFTLAGLNLTEDLDKDGKADAGPGTTKRTITVQLRNQFADVNGVVAWVFDTTEVPSGLTFNPGSPELVTAKLVAG
jgi:hypothetical protein